MEIVRDNISQFTIGIRFEKSFRVSDITGHIFDVVLHDRSTPFGTEFFPQYQAFGSHDRMLVNSDRGYYLRVTTSDIIFQYSISSTDDLEKELRWFRNDATAFIVDKILGDNRITNIMRIGFMTTHIINGENVGGHVLEKLTAADIKTADQFTLRFGNKDTTVDGMIKKGVNDYINKITTIKQISDTQYDVTLDFQYYFLPSLETLKGWDFSAFFDRAMHTLDEKFYAMINIILGELVEVQ